MLCLYKEWYQFQVWIKDLFSLRTTSCNPGIPAFSFDPPMQSGTLKGVTCSFV